MKRLVVLLVSLMMILSVASGAFADTADIKNDNHIRTPRLDRPVMR